MFEGKPGINWVQIKAMYNKGESVYAISRWHTKEHFSLTRQAIEQKAKKDGWYRANRFDPSVMKNSELITEVATTLEDVENQGVRGSQIRAYGNRTPENATRILSAVQLGMSATQACKIVGFKEGTLRAWRESDDDFDNALIAAAAVFHEKNVGRIDGAAERGDWKASSWLLGNSPHTKSEYVAEKDQVGGITVTINIPLPDPIPIIDITPSEE